MSYYHPRNALEPQENSAQKRTHMLVETEKAMFYFHVVYFNFDLRGKLYVLVFTCFFAKRYLFAVALLASPPPSREITATVKLINFLLYNFLN